jgi:hypothetical protein
VNVRRLHCCCAPRRKRGALAGARRRRATARCGVVAAIRPDPPVRHWRPGVLCYNRWYGPPERQSSPARWMTWFVNEDES